MKLLVATKNRGKLEEIRDFLKCYFDEIYSLLDFPHLGKVVEDGCTFCENSLKKAIFYSKHLDFYVLGDDSGLMVDVLNGFPGVFSSRWAGESLSDGEKYRLLLEKLKGVPYEKRKAKFVSCITLAKGGEELFTVKGECRGYILEYPMGEGGFGYDPIFYLPEVKKTFAQLSTEEKNSFSHRGIALRLFLKELKKKKSDIFKKSGV